MNLIILIPFFFLIALLYSMAGLGGGSAYITVMVLTGVPKDIFPVIALLCNLIVAGQGAIHFRRAGHFRWHLFWPFAATSIPLAYLGGRLYIPDIWFKAILAAALSIASIRLLFWKKSKVKVQTEEKSLIIKLIIGSLLGLMAGITGIGGGIYLIPVLILTRLATPQEASAVASLFIVVNSMSGLAGQLSKGHVDWQLFLPLSVVVFIAGFIGSRIGARRLKGEILQKIVGLIMIIAVAKLISQIF